MWRLPGAAPEFDDLLTLDLASVEPSVAGPRRPQDRVPLTGLRENFRSAFPDGLKSDVEGPPRDDPPRRRWT
jgi:aconitate hydratase